MRYFYSFLMILLTPYLLFRLWWKGRRLPEYKKRVLERFSCDRRENSFVDVWIHAVSLGEVIAAIPLIDALLKQNRSLLITTMTPTGAQRVQTQFGDKVTHRYVPYDLPAVVKRFFKRENPKIGIIMETELWPNLIHYAHNARIPLFLANARLSERSLQGYLKFKFLFKPVLNQFSAILAQSLEDAKRFIALGAQDERVHVLGNIKFDLQTNTVDSDKFIALKNHWGNERVTVIAASTHEDEESQILAKLKNLQQAIPQIVLLIAPRHPERFKTVYQLCVQAGFNTGLRSNLATLSKNNEVVVLDSLGELLGMYQISDFAFVGGSFVPVGGHNVLEPIAMNVPVFSGTHVHNFKTICQDLKEAQAIQLVDNAEQLVEGIITLYKDPELKNRMVHYASVVLKKNKGALLKHLEKIEEVL